MARHEEIQKLCTKIVQSLDESEILERIPSLPEKPGHLAHNCPIAKILHEEIHSKFAVEDLIVTAEPLSVGVSYAAHPHRQMFRLELPQSLTDFIFNWDERCYDPDLYLSPETVQMKGDFHGYA